jgi:hypothetical protein
MHYLLVRHRVADFAKWHRVFASRAKAQRDAGLHLLHLLHDSTDPNLVVMLFRADDPEAERAFMSSSDAGQAAQSSGVIGVPEISLLSE